MHGLRRSDSEPVATGHNLRIAVWNHSLTCSGVSLMYVCYHTYMQHSGWLRLFSRVFVTIFEGLFWGWADPHSRPPHASFFRSWPTDDSNGTQGGVCLLLQATIIVIIVGCSQLERNHLQGQLEFLEDRTSDGNANAQSSADNWHHARCSLTPPSRVGHSSTSLTFSAIFPNQMIQ